MQAFNTLAQNGTGERQKLHSSSVMQAGIQALRRDRRKLSCACAGDQAGGFPETSTWISIVCVLGEFLNTSD